MSKVLWKTTLLVGLLCLLTGFGVQAQERKIRRIEAGDSLEVMREKIAANGWSFTVGRTWFSDLPAEQKAKMLSRRPSANPKAPQAPGVGPLASRLNRQSLPSSFDWRNQGGKTYIGPIRNQGTCGSCYSFGASAAAEGAYNKANNFTDSNCTDFSESYIAWCLGSLPNYKSHFFGCKGADYEYMELSALTTTQGLYPDYDGAALEVNCPYSETELNPSSYLGKIPTIKFDNWYRVYPADYNDTTTEIKKAIMEYGVVDAAVWVSQGFEDYTGGVFDDGFTNPTTDPYYNENTNHAIALVGWDDNPIEGGGGCWILRNSWGESWGESGYMRIRYKAAAVNCAVCYLTYTGGGGEDVTLTMVSSPLAGGTTTPTGASTVKTGQPFSITAASADGYVFQSWAVTAGSGVVTNSKLSQTTATASGDLTITATFITAAPMSVDAVSINLDNSKQNRDMVAIRKGELPSDTNQITYATLKLDDAVFSCNDGIEGAWSPNRSGTKYNYVSYDKSPSVRISVDVANKTWDAKISKANIHQSIDANDGLKIEFSCDGGGGVASLGYNDLDVKTKIRY